MRFRNTIAVDVVIRYLYIQWAHIEENPNRLKPRGIFIFLPSQTLSAITHNVVQRLRRAKLAQPFVQFDDHQRQTSLNLKEDEVTFQKFYNFKKNSEHELGLPAPALKGLGHTRTWL